MSKDPVNHPSHYLRGRFETIEVIEEWGLGFCLGNTVKYISRAGHKDPAKEIEDLKKARWYLDRHIAQLEGAESKPRASIDLVREFHEAFGQCVHDEPYIGDDKLNDLRCDLIAEELRELETALADCDPVATLDALTDLQYVLDGAYLSLGFHRYKDAALAEVHRSNLTKLGADGKPILRADGKIMKPAGYSPPDLASVLDPPSPFHVEPRSTHILDEDCPDCSARVGEWHRPSCPYVLTVPPAPHLRLDTDPGAMGPTGNEAADVGQWRESIEGATERRRAELDSDAPLNSYEWKGQR